MNLPEWLPESRLLRLAIQIAAALAVLGLLAGGGWAWYRVQEARSEAALAEAWVLVQQAEASVGSVEARTRAIQALEAVVSRYPRYSGSIQAAFELGNLRYAAGEYGAARGAYQVALARGATGTVRALAALGIGYTWEAEKNWASAQEAYGAAARDLGPKDFLFEEILMDLARAQEMAGKPAQALETYQRLLKDLPNPKRGDEIRTRIADLQSKPGK